MLNSKTVEAIKHAWEYTSKMDNIMKNFVCRLIINKQMHSDLMRKIPCTYLKGKNCNHEKMRLDHGKEKFSVFHHHLQRLGL